MSFISVALLHLACSEDYRKVEYKPADAGSSRDLSEWQSDNHHDHEPGASESRHVRRGTGSVNSHLLDEMYSRTLFSLSAIRVSVGLHEGSAPAPVAFRS